jgi:4-methyl-5(b-hydroxyethyl)-thiazole monophosphate biosynthesis
MKKTAVLMYPNYSEYELSVALSILMQAEKPVVTVAVSREPVRGEAGLVCLPDATVDDINPEEIDSLLLTGCMDIFALNEGEVNHLVNFIQRVVNEDTIIGSISSSPYLLAKAGLLNERNYTIGMYEDDRKKTSVFNEAYYSNDLVVRDGTLITARGSGFIRFGIDFGKTLNLKFDERWYLEA